MASTETPFRIAIPDSELALLQQKLALTRLPDELDGAGWNYGAPLVDIRRLVKRWQDGYDWRASETRLNAELPQFTRDIEVEGHGKLNIHYVHKKSARKNAIPLLFAHGWPGSFLEARKIIPLLISDENVDSPSFHVVAPSLAGFGFSEAPKKPGFAVPQHAEACHKLMLSLGYNEYVTQGGDWGHSIVRSMASVYGPQHSKAWHTNVIFKNMESSGDDKEDAPEPGQEDFEKRILQTQRDFLVTGHGYFIQQSTRPQTIGYNLSDSPVGLLAWIYEKLVSWTDEYPWSDDEVLEWISIYWFSKAGPAASTRIYYENQKSMMAGNKMPKTTIPMGLSYFPAELGYAQPKWVRENVGNLVSYNYHQKGGHFAAHERPEDLVEDVKKMFVKGGPAYGVVSGKDGY